MASGFETLRTDLDAGGKRIFGLPVPSASGEATYTENAVSPAAPAAVAAPGTSRLASPADHVHPAINELLNGEPNSVGVTYTPTYASGLLSAEEWKATSGGAKIKTIDYTYSSGLVSTEVRKIYAANGTTIIGQITISYVYTSGALTSATQVRNV